MEIPCVYNFDGPSKHVNLVQQLIDVGNNPAVRTEVDADSGKQRRPNTGSPHKRRVWLFVRSIKKCMEKC